MRRPNAVEVANEKVSIVVVCRMLGLDLPEDIGSARARKVHCPFGEIYHSDQGLSPAMRIYPDTNSAYCFSCAAYFTPVNLAARAMDLTQQAAAINLLDRVGHRPLDLVAAFHDAREHTPEPDKALLADALKTYCRRICPSWGNDQFEPHVARVLTRCLSLLDLVRNDDDVRLWLSRCKEVMRRALVPTEQSPSQKYAVLLESISGKERKQR